jgi:hypothetical protein
MHFLAGTFFAYYAVMVASELYEPRRTGIGFEFSDGRMVIIRVVTNSPASRAGLMPGDRVRAVDGRTIQQWEDWSRFVAAREIGRPYHFAVERAGREAECRLALGRQTDDPLGRLERKRYVQFILLLLALILVYLRPRQGAARFGAWFLAGIGTAPVFPGSEMTAIWRALPVPLGAVLWIPQFTHLMLLPIFFTFFAIFPRPLFKARWPWAVVWFPAVLVAAWCFPLTYDHIYHPPVLEDLPRWLRFVLGLAILVYGGGALTALMINCRRMIEPGDRQRVRVMTAGAVLGLLPGLPFLAAIFWGTLTQSEFVWFFVSTDYRLFALGCFLAFPLSLGYAVLRHRVLDLTTSANR